MSAASFIAAAAVGHTGSGQPPAGQTSPQPAQPAQTSGQPLDLPENINFVGQPQDRNVARATAIVNDEIITQTDIDQRVAVELASRRIERVTPEEMQLLRNQVFRALVDEALQIQAAREIDIKADPAEINRYYARYAQTFGHTAQTFGDFLRTIGSSERSVKRQIEGEVAWLELQRARLPRISVASSEVQERLERMNAARGAYEYRVAEIALRPKEYETMEQVRAKAAQIVEQIRTHGPQAFATLARDHSDASTAARGGDLGWVRTDRLPAEITAVLQAMPVGAISNPIQLPTGYSIILLLDSRQVLVANPRDAVLSLMQMAITLPPGTTEAQARQRAGQLSQATRSMGGCGGAAQVATTIGAELVAQDDVVIRNLPPALQQLLLNMNIGETTQVLGDQQRIFVLIMCGRDDPEAAATPTFASLAEQLEEERMQRQAQRFLRDLRRDAVIEYR